MTINAEKTFDLSKYGINQKAYRNANPAVLYQLALAHDNGSIASSGALVALSGAKTGRSPKDKRAVKNPASQDNIWWGDIIIPLSEDSFEKNKAIAINHLAKAENLDVLD